ncbi:MAG: helix-turn-helix domain-containing protein [Clostridium sp.]|uniref:helix-turn-helix transcriptional regulator n=1 Tax=Clostridium sp. TaxID=1506 RepID=UPI0039EBB3BA
MGLGNHLKEIRMKEYMMSQMEFAKLIGVNYRQYNRWENGTAPSGETMLNIAKKLNKKVEDIFYIVE